jgi:hypothetical protein
MVSEPKVSRLIPCPGDFPLRSRTAPRSIVLDQHPQFYIVKQLHQDFVVREIGSTSDTVFRRRQVRSFMQIRFVGVGFVFLHQHIIRQAIRPLSLDWALAWRVSSRRDWLEFFVPSDPGWCVRRFARGSCTRSWQPINQRKFNNVLICSFTHGGDDSLVLAKAPGDYQKWCAAAG